MKQLTLMSLSAVVFLTACPPTGVVCKAGVCVRTGTPPHNVTTRKFGKNRPRRRNSVVT